MRWLATVFIASALSLSLPDNVYGVDYLCKNVDSEWTWFGDHAALRVDYIVVGAPERSYETGTGIFVRGQPWGTWKVNSGIAKFSAYGIGALHIRKVDAGAPFKVCATAKDLEPTTIFRAEF